MHNQMKRANSRNWNEARKVEFVLDYLKYAEGSCLVIAENTKILSRASYEAIAKCKTQNAKTKTD